MNKILQLLTALLAVTFSSYAQSQTPPSLGAAREFAVLGTNAVTSIGSSVLYGDLGTSPGTLITGFPTGKVVGKVESGTTVAANAKTDIVRVYNELGQFSATQNLTGKTLGAGFSSSNAAVRGTTLNRGVYKFDGDARISGRLKFDGQNNPNSVFVVQVNGNLIIEEGSVINVFNASANNVFFQVTGNIQIGAGGMTGTPSNLSGNFLVRNNAVLSLGTSLVGRILSTTGDVTLSNNNISLPEPITSGSGNDDGDVEENATLEISKTANSSTVTLGDNVVYTIRVTNRGPEDASSVTVEDKLPAGLTLVPPAEADRGTYNATTGIWTIGALPANQTATLRITAKTTALGEITNVAVIGGGGSSSDVTICVRPARPNVVGVGEVCANGSASYTVSNVSTGVTRLAIEVPANSGLSVESQTLSGFTVKAGATTAPGTYTITVIAVVPGNCQNSRAFPVELVVGATPTVPVIAAPQVSALCSGTTYQYRVEQPVAGITYTWSVTGTGWEVIGAATGTQVQVKAGTGTGKVTVVATNACGTATASTQEVTPGAAPAMPVVIDNSGPCTGLTYSISNPTAGLVYTWTAPAGFTFADNSTTATGTSVTLKSSNANATGTLTVTAGNTVGAACPSSAASVEVNASAAGSEIVIPTVFSPNGDNINDTWVIKNLLNFPDNDLALYNRWGNEIYKTKGYKNDWRATGLEEGTYVYVLRVRGCDGKEQVFRGMVQVVR
ncbi:DUF3494 domain-containing protein [Rufibacter immobilis]|uniref:DUF3494 domain-containing protein n=1 Tax=Rufibacter immobilis TaxID=1348778 RepID=A0A3M9N5H2_9BACT|nr:ice-binding family protein [Rufibacter immobilis]RNI32557.1 DUF3494 domain-containing protein [Rufibacter immobilis]